jgi:hypothetical protein
MERRTEVMSAADVSAITRRVILKAVDELGVHFIAKGDSKLMHFIYKWTAMKWWNPNFMTAYTTTIWKTIYLNRPIQTFGTGKISDLATINHEVQHVKDAIALGPLAWAAMYLFPQILAPLALLGFFNPTLWVFLLALLPWPAPGRVWAEVRGYAMSLVTRSTMGLPVTTEHIENLREKFTGWHYYRMAWRWKPVHDAIQKRFAELDGMR